MIENDNGYRRKDLKVKDDILYCRGVDTKWRIHRDMVHGHMFWIIFEDGTHSADYYNYTRAKENAMELYLSEVNGIVPYGAGEARGCV